MSPSEEVRVEVRPRWVFRMPRFVGKDGLARIRGGVLHRLLHFGSDPVVVRAVQLRSGSVLFGARASSREACEWGVARMRLALGVDQDLAAFHSRFRFDPLIGAALRADPGLRVAGRPDPFEALMLAVCEQLIEYDRAAAIQRRLILRFGRSAFELRDAPCASVLAGVAPAELQSMDLAAGRALALIRCAREVASGRVDLLADDPLAGWRRLLTIRGIGAWTVQTMALSGQGRLDQLPAGDLAYLKLVGRLLHGDRFARASEAEVSEFFAPYAPWAGLAGAYALRATADRAALRIAA